MGAPLQVDGSAELKPASPESEKRGLKLGQHAQPPEQVYAWWDDGGIIRDLQRMKEAAAEALGQGYQFRDGGGIAMEFRLDTHAQVDALAPPDAVPERLRYVADALRGRCARFDQAGACRVAGAARLRRLAVDPRHLYGRRWQLRGLRANQAVVLHGSWHVRAKGTAAHLTDQAFTGIRGLSVDWTSDLTIVRRALPANVAVQGNLDPVLLNTTPEIVTRETTRLLESMRGTSGHIFNLGHGIMPHAKIECMQALVDTVTAWR
jgi:hypothetical protein